MKINSCFYVLFIFSSKSFAKCNLPKCYAFSLEDKGHRISPIQINYENRLRKFSDNEKIFKYFSTIEFESKVYMTCEDFARSLTMGCPQPKNLGLDLFTICETFEKIPKHVEKAVPQCLFEEIYGPQPLIEFCEYIFYKVLLSISPRNLSILFDLIDKDGDTKLSSKEFLEFLSSIAKYNTTKNPRLIQILTKNIQSSKIFK